MSKYKVKEDFLWFKKGQFVDGEDNKDYVDGWLKNGLIEKDSELKIEENFDINNDGKVDEKDLSLAAKVLRKGKKKSSKKNKK